MTTPEQVEQELVNIGEEIERWTELTAWHAAQKDWRTTRLSIADARARLEYAGMASKTKYHAIVATEQEQTDLDIAAAQLGLCEKRLRALSELKFTTLGRSKSISNSYTGRF